jgi:methionine biosynthesis protein MetW
MGVDIDLESVIRVLDRGHDVFQGDVDKGLAMVPDGTYDCAVLSETLQVVRRPREVLRELLRVAREGIVSFPNFAQWRLRLQLGLGGRMPKGGALPFEWYETPNIHLFTLCDFLDLCRAEGWRVEETVCLGGGWFSRALSRLGWRNAGAERVLVRITRADGRSGGEKESRK